MNNFGEPPAQRARTSRWVVVGCTVVLACGVVLAALLVHPRSSHPSFGAGLVLPLPTGFRYLGVLESGGNGDPPGDCPGPLVATSQVGESQSLTDELQRNLVARGWRGVMAGDEVFGVPPEAAWTLVRREKPHSFVSAYVAQTFTRARLAAGDVEVNAFVQRATDRAKPGEVVLLLELVDVNYPACLGAQAGEEEMISNLESLLDRGASDQEIDAFFEKKYPGE